MRWILVALRVALAAGFLVAGLAALGLHGDMAAAFRDLGASWLMWVVGLWAVAAAIGLLTPRWNGLAAGSLALLMVAVMAVQLFVRPVGSIIVAFGLFVLTLVVALASIGQRTPPGDRPPRLPRAL